MVIDHNQLPGVNLLVMGNQNDLKSFKDRILWRIEDQGYNQRTFAQFIGVNPQNITHWIKRGQISGPKKLKVSKALNCRLEWLENGEQPIEQDQGGYATKLNDDNLSRMSSHHNVRPGPDLKGDVPLISWVRAGEADLAIDNLEPGDAEEWIPCGVPHSDKAYALRVDGDSMTAPPGSPASFPNGFLIFVDPEQRGGVCTGDFVIAKINGRDAVTFKQLASEEGRPYLRPLNPKHDPIFEEFRILGKVIYAGFKL